MPRFFPRDRPIEKQEELAKREYDLQQVIQHDFTVERLIKAASNYHKAQLSYFKAELHVIREKAFRGIPYKKKENIEIQIEKWSDKTNEEIIDDFKQPKPKQ